jgi:virginiamycin A acetyltransferase
MRLTIIRIVKMAVFGIATLLVVPALFSYKIRSVAFGADRALEGSTQALSLVPGIFGQYLRRAFLARVLASFDWTATIEFGTLFSRAGARIDANAYVGPGCHLGLVHLEHDVLVGAGVHIPSGPATHGIDDLSVPIREQPGEQRMVRIGAGSWIGSGAIVLHDVGVDCVIGAGSVVTHDVEDRVVAAGVPAKLVRRRDPLTRHA